MAPQKSLRYPIGIQTFSKIIEEGYAYVDKTGYIKPLLEHSQYIFLSRPRRFGKSLLVSTLKAYFEGRRELFKGLALDRMEVDWEASPVLHFDFNNGLYKNFYGLLAKLHDTLSVYEEKYGIPVGEEREEKIPTRFRKLIETASEQNGRKVVILVDEYDKPLLDIEDYPELFEKNQRILKSFYGNLKSMDSMIRMVFITGVARFSKVSIFSDLNNLDDIALEDTFADICGWTEEEILGTFRSGIEELAKKRGETAEATLKVLRDFYDGYKFTTEGSRLYNPFSVLRALKAKSIEPYWFETGTPTFLARRVKRQGVYPPDINGEMCSKPELTAVGMNDTNPFPLMFQTGYLTIGEYDSEVDLYTLRFPNREVEIGFYKYLLPIYAPETADPGTPFTFPKFKMDLYQGRPEDFMKRLASLLKDLPGEDHRESTYRAVTYLVATLCATQTIAEHHGYKGRSDIETMTSKYIYIFEFKYNGSVEEAMRQIKSRDYAGRYEMDPREIYLIAANYNEKKEERGLQYRIEKLKASRG
ncbi:MAG: ATP-binding protein [Muribaculaceae bacterium]|nr:ATP-binding protein [Muribaculaceae bacterium]